MTVRMKYSRVEISTTKRIRTTASRARRISDDIGDSRRRRMNNQTSDLLTLTPVMPNVQPQTKESIPISIPPNKREAKHKEMK
jgi:hypothetical protein